MLRKMISMARTVPEMADAANPTPHIPLYDYGLNLCFNQETLDKLNLDTEDVEPGDKIHMIVMAQVTSVSKNDTGDGPQHRIELQITDIGLENESLEYMDEAE